MFRSVLIANRGEIARRIARTCHRLDIEPIMICTDLDASAPHTNEEYVRRVSSYLDIGEIVAAAVAARADAVHPGYGFLSERAAFARALEAAGITLVGPTADVMEQLGRKDLAREIADAAGVPVVPQGEPTDAAGRDWQGPVLVKAVAGGGGKGMRVVRSPAELDEAMAAATREALAAFGDDTMLIERYVEHGRHIEVQVLGDQHGTVVHLGERDCSTQRRHQKVLEEAPAPTLDAATRDRICQAGVDLAASVGYTGAGTVEFLLDTDSGDFFFLEMNTRLQVEHPVTEAVVRVAGKPIDLVEQQLLVAAGEPLAFAQDDVELVGHAIEARVYAEDSFGGFLPQAGTATEVIWPREDRFGELRVDHALESGQVVTTAYDPMLAKIIAHGEDREEAREGLLRALDDTAVFGLTTNAGFLRALVASDEFRDATIDTAWLDRNQVPAPTEDGARLLAGMALRRVLDQAPVEPFMPDGFRLGGPPGRLFEHGRQLSPSGGWYSYDGGRRTEGAQRFTIGVDAWHDGFVLRGRHGTEVVLRGQRFVLGEPDPSSSGLSAGSGAVVAPMPGTVLEVRVAVGERVEQGAVLGVLEAMKMELAVRAPFAGTVTAVTADAGQQVPIGAPMFEIEESDDDTS